MPVDAFNESSRNMTTDGEPLLYALVFCVSCVGVCAVTEFEFTRLNEKISRALGGS